MSESVEAQENPDLARKTNINEGLILDTKASMQNNTKYIISVTAKKVLKELEDKKNK